MAKPSETPQIFCTQANYSTLVARATRNGTPTKVDAGNAWRNEGAKPAEGSPAQAFNYEANIWSKYVRWVYEGKATADADAHIVETDTTGRANIRSAKIGLAGVTPSGNNVFEVRGNVPAPKFGAVFDFTGASTTNSAMQIYSAARSALTVECQEGANTNTYGRYQAILARTDGHGVLAHPRSATPAAVKFALDNDVGMFSAYAGSNLHAFVGKGNGTLMRLERSGTDDLGVAMSIISGNGHNGKLAYLQQQTPKANTSKEYTFHIDAVGDISDNAGRSACFVDSSNMEGSIFQATEPGRSGASGCGFALGGYLKPRGSQSTFSQGSCGIHALQNARGGSGIRVLRDGSRSDPMFTMPETQQAYDVRLLDPGNQAISMGYSPTSSTSVFNPGNCIGLTAHQRSGSTPLLQARRGAFSSGFGTESVMTTNGRPIHWIQCNNAGQSLTLLDGTVPLVAIDSATAPGPAPRMPYPIGATISIKVSFNATVTANTDVGVILIIRDDNTNTDIHTVDLGQGRDTSDDRDKVFNYCGTVQRVVPAGHRSFSARLAVTANGSQGGGVGSIYDACMEIHCLNSDSGD